MENPGHRGRVALAQLPGGNARQLGEASNTKLKAPKAANTKRTGVSKPSNAKTALNQKPKVATVLEQTADTLLTVEDIDAEESDIPLLCSDTRLICSEYVKDIFTYLMDLEVQQAVRPEYLKGSEITPHMRALLIDWLVQVHSRFQLVQETLYLTVAILDRFLQVQPVSRKKLQLVGVTAMLLASKYEEEMYCPKVQVFAYITDNAFTKPQIRVMEQVVLKCLNFELGRPLPLHFLRRASMAGSSTVERYTLAKYLMELTLLDYKMVHYQPSEIAAASLCLSQLLLDGLPWTPTQEHYAIYDEAHLKPIVRCIAKNVVAINEGKTKFQAIQKKYSSILLMKIALRPELNSATLKRLAAPPGQGGVP